MRAIWMGVLIMVLAANVGAEDIRDKVEHGYADNRGVKIHYVAMGQGPLVLLIHGFPDYWYSWREQMPALAEKYRVVAMDQRGYNQSDKPEGDENYALPLLISDAVAVIKAAGAEKATVVGHDWGGIVAWQVAAFHPDIVERLVILNLPHPKCLERELATNPVQQQNSAYARAFQQPGAEALLSPEFLAGIVAPKDAAAREAYKEGFANSDFKAMLAYYRQNYPREPYTQGGVQMPNIEPPVLQFHGLKDTALVAAGLNNTWEYLDGPWTLVTVPEANHWVHHDAAELVTNTILDWLARN